jgi:hypothetical protein
MNYTNDTHMCRVEVFKPSGKWYMTEAVSFEGLYHDVDGYRKGIDRHFRGRANGMWAVCFDFYSENEFPHMIQISASGRP